MSRHHILPPIVYTPEPPKPKETRRRRRVGDAGTTGGVEETDEANEAETTTPVRNTAVPPHARPVESVERRTPSTTGKLSDDTLKALLAVQEEEGGQGGD